MNWLADLALMLVAGVCDRVRGGYPDDRLYPEGKPAWVDHGRHVLKFVYGLALGGIITDDWRVVLAMAVTWKFGEQVASDFGGTFRLIAGVKYWARPLIRVGFLWPLLSLPLAWFDLRVLVLLPASMLGVFLGALAAKFIPWPSTAFLQMHTKAGWQEMLRGILIAAFAAVFVRAV